MTQQTRTIADYAASYIKQFGMALVPLPPRQKRPNTEDWGNLVLTDPAAAREYYTRNPDANMGCALGPSRVCSFDVDDIDATRAIFEEFGWDLDALRDGYPTIQGSPGGFRVMFRVPDDMRLPYHALTWPKQDGTRGRYTVWEIRSADDGQARQDVLPPSIHPDTQQPYVWLTKPTAGGLPPPPAFLLAIWSNWDALKPQFQAVCPWAQPAAPTQAARQPAPAARDSVIDAYAAATPIERALAQYGYKQQGKRWLSPHSQTKLPGVVVLGGKAFIHHASDPLCTDESGRPVDAFDLFCEYEHGGDKSKAMRAAAVLLGMEYKRPAPPPPVQRQTIDPETGEITDMPPAANDNPAPLVWGAPIDVFGIAPPPTLPIDVLPEALQAYVVDQAGLTGCDPAIIGLGALVAAAACITDAIKLQPKRHDPTWTESARLWVAFIGDPSTKKSPAISKAVRHVKRIDHRMAEENASAYADYKWQHDSWKEAKKADKSSPIAEPEKPATQRLVVEDVTVEALTEVLRDNPRGVLTLKDELTGWFASMDAYKGANKGASMDRAHWLEAYNGGRRSIDRITRGQVIVPNWSTCIIGGVQPDMMRRVASGMGNDGLLQRFMVLVARKATEDADRSPDMNAMQAFGDLFDRLSNLQGADKPVTLCEQAHRSRERVAKYAKRLIDAVDHPHIQAWLGKWDGLYARLLLTYHVIECATDSTYPTSRVVSEETAAKVERLLCGVLLHHAIHFYTELMDAHERQEHIRQLARLLLARRFERVTKRDITLYWKASRRMEWWELRSIVDALCTMDWLAPDYDAMDTDGKPRAWHVNPDIHKTFTDAAEREQARRRDAVEALREIKQAYSAGF